MIRKVWVWFVVASGICFAAAAILQWFASPEGLFPDDPSFLAGLRVVGYEIVAGFAGAVCAIVALVIFFVGRHRRKKKIGSDIFTIEQLP